VGLEITNVCLIVNFFPLQYVTIVFQILILHSCVVELNVIESFSPYILQEHFHHFFLKDLFNVALNECHPHKDVEKMVIIPRKI
jgi:hypothetical protein